jgi:hypothetical protein
MRELPGSLGTFRHQYKGHVFSIDHYQQNKDKDTAFDNEGHSAFET